MEHTELSGRCASLSTPLIADACLRLKHSLRLVPFGIKPILPGQMLAGRVLPVRHYGSVDVFLEAMLSGEPGDVLVIDNAGRNDEACAGDLTALEAKAHHLSGIVIWGCHRDTRELIAIAFPVFSYGSCSTGPQRLDRQDPQALLSAKFGTESVTKNDIVFADEDGALFVSADILNPVLAAAENIRNKERKQAEAVQNGMTLTKQLKFDEYLRKRNGDAAYTFREHLRKIGGAIEE